MRGATTPRMASSWATGLLRGLSFGWSLSTAPRSKQWYDLSSMLISGRRRHSNPLRGRHARHLKSNANRQALTKGMPGQVFLVLDLRNLFQANEREIRMQEVQGHNNHMQCLVKGMLPTVPRRNPRMQRNEDPWLGHRKGE